MRGNIEKVNQAILSFILYTKAKTLATASKSSSGIKEETETFESKFAKWSSLCMGTAFSVAFSIMRSAKEPLPEATTFGASGLPSSCFRATASFTSHLSPKNTIKPNISAKKDMRCIRQAILAFTSGLESPKRPFHFN